MFTCPRVQHSNPCSIGMHAFTENGRKESRKQKRHTISRSFSLHLDNIQYGYGHDLSKIESPEPNGDHKIDLFQRYVSACSQMPSSENSEGSDDSIHHGRDSSASSSNDAASRRRFSGSFLPEFYRRASPVSLPGPRDRHSIFHSFHVSSQSSPRASSPLTLPQRDERRKSSSLEPSLNSCRSRPPEGESKGESECALYASQIARTLAAGKSVWL
jgi:hypothetical protein